VLSVFVSSSRLRELPDGPVVLRLDAELERLQLGLVLQHIAIRVQQLPRLQSEPSSQHAVPDRPAHVLRLVSLAQGLPMLPATHDARLPIPMSDQCYVLRWNLL